MSVKAAGYVVFRRVVGIEYLLLQASYGDFHWSPPKGHVDIAETDYMAALREVREETGLDESKFIFYEHFKRNIEYDVKGKEKEVSYWLAELKDKDTPIKLSAEHQDYKWLPLDKACEYVRYPDLQEVLQDSQKYIDRGCPASVDYPDGS